MKTTTEKKNKKNWLILIALLALFIGLLIPFTWESLKTVKASLSGTVTSPAATEDMADFSGSVAHGGYLPSNTPTRQPSRTPTRTATQPPTATITPTSSPTQTATQPPKQSVTPTNTVVPTTPAPSQPPTVGPGGDPNTYSTAGFIFIGIAIAAFFLYFFGTIIFKRDPD